MVCKGKCTDQDWKKSIHYLEEWTLLDRNYLEEWTLFGNNYLEGWTLFG